LSIFIFVKHQVQRHVRLNRSSKRDFQYSVLVRPKGQVDLLILNSVHIEVFLVHMWPLSEQIYIIPKLLMQSI